MNTSSQTRAISSSSSRPHSLFYRDLSASPATRPSPLKGDGGMHTSQSSASPWQSTGNSSSCEQPPPPPIFSLQDRMEHSPVTTSHTTTSSNSRNLASSFCESLPSKTSDNRAFGATPSLPPSPLTPLGTQKDTPLLNNFGEVKRGSFSPLFASPQFHGFQQYRHPGNPDWWSPLRTQGQGSPPGGVLFERDGMKGRDDCLKERDDCVKGDDFSPVSGVVQKLHEFNGGFTLPPTGDVTDARFQISGNSNVGKPDDDGGGIGEWITAFGFGPDETNIVMRELEKCGTILKHVPGPGCANWIHVQFQNKREAQKALYKNGIQLAGALIVGIKPLDLIQRQILLEKKQKTAFNVLPPKAKSYCGDPKTSGRSYYLQPSGGTNAVGPIASPSKSIFSKVADLVFGL